MKKYCLHRNTVIGVGLKTCVLRINEITLKTNTKFYQRPFEIPCGRIRRKTLAFIYMIGDTFYHALYQSQELTKKFV